ncbi:hypothetical protein FFLO_02936 [Filobasidium floriforme]|uniref:Kinetochore protein n=1 Tax=Filobasidium floriforme TaxID=5210 RepID=A0A8K0NRC3_9TREE|nr:hypothetical protein FFLO_02936 [Filobasidium floriforme]
MSTDAVSTRIPIQRKDNWVQVTETVKTFATERMEAHLNLLSTDGDQRKNNALKREVRERIKRILENAVEYSHRNLLVNGEPYEDCKEAPTEQFDEGLDRKLLALQREQVEWSSVIAERRRKAPGQAKDLEDMLENIKESLEWDVDMDEAEAEGEGKEKEGGEEMMLDPERLPPRHEETIETYKKTLINLNEVLSNAPEQVSRAERAKAVRETVMNLPK